MLGVTCTPPVKGLGATNMTADRRVLLLLLLLLYVVVAAAAAAAVAAASSAGVEKQCTAEGS